MGDADCTYDFRLLAPFVERFRDGYEFVMGSRWRGSIEPGSMPALHRYLGTPVTTWILNRVSRSRFSDIHCGMRGITRDALERMDLHSQSWEYASEMMLKSVQMELRTTEVPVRFLKDREGRLSHHKRSGWLSPWKAAWINLRAMFVYGSDFFVFKPGLVLIVLGAPAHRAAQLRRPSSSARSALSLNWQFLGVALLAAGAQAFFLGCIAQVLFDYTGRHRRRWLRVFPYTRTVLIAFGLVIARHRDGDPARGDLHRQRLALEQADTLPEPSRRHRARAAILGVQLFVFTLLLHGTIIATTRGRPPSRAGAARATSYVQYYGRLARAVGLLDREGPGAAVRAPRGGTLGRARDGLSRSRPTRRGRSTTSSAGCYRAVRRNTLVDVWRCYELWSLVGELRDVPGAILEVGVWRGGTGALMAARAAALGHRRAGLPLRHLEGVVKTGAVDTYYHDGKHDDASHEHVERAHRGLGLENVELLQGSLPRRHRRPQSPTQTFRLCHCDVDVYQSAKDVFDWVGRGSSPGGVVVFDDYGFPACPGVTSSSTSSACSTTGSSSTTSTGMASSSSAEASRGRTGAYGQHRSLTPVDRFGVWLSARALRRHVPSFAGKRVGDFGCGFDATLRPFACSTTWRMRRSSTWRSPPDLKRIAEVTAIEGDAPRRGPPVEATSLDVTLCLSVLEHLWDPSRALRELRRVAAPGRRLPPQRAVVAREAFLEFSAFRLGLSPAEEIGRPQDATTTRATCCRCSPRRASSLTRSMLQAQVRPQHLRGLQDAVVSFSESYLEETGRIVGELDPDPIERLATGLAEVRDGGGRLFVLGVGGSAAHAGHAVNDFRKLCGFETYAPTDNVSELTARVNDDGWDSAYVEWLRGSRLGSGDAVLVLSVGGGSVATNLSANLVAAMTMRVKRVHGSSRSSAVMVVMRGRLPMPAS